MDNDVGSKARCKSRYQGMTVEVITVFDPVEPSDESEYRQVNLGDLSKGGLSITMHISNLEEVPDGQGEEMNTLNHEIVTQKPKRPKEQFLAGWEDYVDQFTLLGHSAASNETWQEIKKMREGMRRLVHKVAGEVYGAQLPAGRIQERGRA